jgi:Protein of unknown function (DUF732)
MKKMWIAAAMSVLFLVGAGPARADSNSYLELLEKDQFYSRLGPQVLLQEGNKVCQLTARGMDQDSIASIVERDVSVSPVAAGEIVGAANFELGC